MGKIQKKRDCPDALLLDCLTLRTRCLSESQARALTSLERHQCRAVLGRMVADGLVRRTTAWAIAEPPAGAEPLWKTGDPEDKLEDAIRRGVSRWRGLVPSEVTLYVATQKAALLTGGKAKAPRASEVSHDLALAAAFLAQAEEQRQEWLKEDCLSSLVRPAIHQLQADAARGDVAVEVVGASYTTCTVAAFVGVCRDKGCAVELW